MLLGETSYYVLLEGRGVLLKKAGVLWRGRERYCPKKSVPVLDCSFRSPQMMARLIKASAGVWLPNNGGVGVGEVSGSGRGATKPFLPEPPRPQLKGWEPRGNKGLVVLGRRQMADP